MNQSDILSVETIRFVPFRSNNILRSFPARFRITDPNLKISAASAFYPTMAVICQNLFDPSVFIERASLDKTYNAKGFSDLADGKIDLFVTFSSDDTRTVLRERLIDFRCEPLFCDPLAVLVNQKNPIRNLSLAQLRDIYAGILTDWTDISGQHSPIHTFQLSEGNVSRVAFNSGIYANPPVRLPESDITTMPELVNKVSTYEAAIGNIFWSYYARMYASVQTRIIKIDGEEPLSAAYPLRFSICLHYDAANPKRQLHELIDYLFSDEGRALTAFAYQSERIVL